MNEYDSLSKCICQDFIRAIEKILILQIYLFNYFEVFAYLFIYLFFRECVWETGWGVTEEEEEGKKSQADTLSTETGMALSQSWDIDLNQN